MRLRLERGEREREALAAIEREVESLEIGPAVWDGAVALARAARTRGITVPVTDLLIASCARHHAVSIEHADSTFALIDALPAG